MAEQTNIPNALLVFSIGPVQDFIATARRTQDLWMGSYILAYLSAAAMRAVVGNQPRLEKVLFPTLEGQPLVKQLWQRQPVDPRELTLATLPNKFTVQVVSLDEGRTLAQAAEKAVRVAWRDLVQAVKTQFAPLWPDPQGGWTTLWDREANPDRWIEIYWAVYPNQAYAYGDLNRRAERAFEARKGLRDFSQAEERGEKCTVCGVRAALGSMEDEARADLIKEWEAIAQRLREETRDEYKGLESALSAKGNERLCAICACKRFVQRFYLEDELDLKGGFPSTSSIATAVYRAEVLAKVGQNERDRFTNALKAANVPRTLAENAFPMLKGAQPGDPLRRYDGDLFYPEMYSKEHMQDDYGLTLDPTQLAKLRGAARDLIKAAGAPGIEVEPPAKYYAVLVLDGDRMGEHLGRAEDAEAHRQLSASVRDFALNDVQRIVEDGGLGRVVYAGGDDVLAFLPIENALSAARQLSEAFNRRTGLTASAGITIAHHQAPLDGVLAASRRAEKAAKDKYGRNAVVVTVLKRSGEQLDVGARWQYGDLDTLTLILKLRDDFSEGLSARFAFEADREAPALSTVDQVAYGKMLTRLLGRHGADLAADKVTDYATQLAALSQGLRGHLPPPMLHTVETARWLLLARFLASAARGED